MPTATSASTNSTQPPTSELALYLQIYEIDPLESFFSLSLRDQQNQRLRDIAFVFFQPQKLLISCIQGPDGAQSQQLVKQLTKQLHGLRPMCFMLNALQLLCQQWRCQLHGIPARAQVKSRWYGHQRIFFDYDTFWREHGGTLQAQYWQLPLHFNSKTLEEIPSKKRAMYRKRYQMLATLAQDMQCNLQK